MRVLALGPALQPGTSDILTTLTLCAPIAEVSASAHAVGETHGATPWGVDRIGQRDLPLDSEFATEPRYGTGVHVYVIDTGIYCAHRDFDPVDYRTPQRRCIPAWDGFGKVPGPCIGANVTMTSTQSCANDNEGVLHHSN